MNQDEKKHLEQIDKMIPMQPDFEVKTVSLYRIDCMEFMKDIPDNFYDLAIVDPPYGINADKKNSDSNKKSKKSASESKFYGNQNWDSNVPGIGYFQELIRISKNQIIWGVNYYPYNLFSGGRLYWHKNVSMPTYSDGELAFCSLINKITYFECTWHGMIQQNMKEKEKRIHPTQKPVQLYKWLLDNYARKGQKIIDTHGGSCSIGCACMDMGFDIDIMEIDKEYFDNAVKRLENNNQEYFEFA